MVRKSLSALLVSVGILWLALICANASQTWNDEKLTADELYAKYGGASEQISMPQAVKYLMDLVNEERRNRGLQKLSWDLTATNAALSQTAEMTKFHYLSHLNLMGEKPNLRYNRFGGTDQVSENVSYRESNQRLYLTKKIVKDIHDRWMASPAHRKNILAPEHNAVGIGITLSWDGEKAVLTAAEEFVDDYGEYSELPGEACAQDTLELAGEFSNRQTKLMYLMIGREPFPQRQSTKELNASLNGYSLPKPFIALLPKNEAYLHSISDVPTFYPINYQASRGRFSVRFSFAGIYDELVADGNYAKFEPGLYYVMLWIALPEAKPFIASTQVIRVEE